MGEGGRVGTGNVPGNPDDSLLIQAVRHSDRRCLRRAGCPPGARRERWVKDTRPILVLKADPRSVDDDSGRNHWAFQPTRRVGPTQRARCHLAADEVDRFLLARLA
jgi:hypothetical protein